MANEAVIIELTPGINPVIRTCADGTGISKGTLLVLTDPNTVAIGGATTTGNAFGGIAAADKVASDGSTTIAAHMSGVFDLKANAAAITAGVGVCLSGANMIRAAVEADFPVGGVIGYAEETAADSEVIRVRLRGI